MKRIAMTALVAWLLASLGLLAQERITLTTPIQADPGASTFAPALVCFDWRGQGVSVHMWEIADGAFVPDGKQFTFSYFGVEAQALMGTLNTADFRPPNPSLRRRLMQKAQTDGKLNAGVIQ